MGLLATLLDPEPVSEDLLKLAPQSSTWVAATRCDLAPILGGVRNTIARLDADASRNVEDAIKEVNKALGCDLQRDLLAGLGDQWLAFNSEQTGRGILGLVLVNPLRNPAKVEQALLAFERMANTEMKRDADRGEPAVSIETAKVGDLSIHYLAIPALAPCWAIKDGRLYVAAFPQILEAAAAETGTGGQGVLGNAGFNAARERVGVSKNAISISYMDLPKLAPRGYQMVLALQRGALGAADLFGMQTPALALPPLNKIAPHLSTSVGATWVDDLGWHYRGVTPFPAADVLGGEQSLVTTVAPAAVAALIPAAARAKQQARMVQGANNLRQIGQGIFLYANEHQGDLPPDLGAIAGYLMAPTMFQAPEHYGRVPLPPPTAKPEEVAKWVNANTDYVYEGLKFKKITTILNPAQAVMAHEKYELKAGGPVNVLYGDGHVELNAAPIVKERVEAQTREAAARNVN
jgi:prepilin-type processing-associated H-X9-DG protein